MPLVPLASFGGRGRLIHTSHPATRRPASYAAICQELGVVPIVEPEVLIDGDHSIERCAEVTEAVLHEVFNALRRQRVVLECIVLKPSMVVPGKEHALQAAPAEVAAQTLRVLRRCVPAAVASINFLSGGQTPAQATANLDAMNRCGAQPWPLSFSYGRALLDPALRAWGGRVAQVHAGQAALLARARLNGAACLGRYTATMEAAG
jgi:fructose-bisphosphate aldolase class I